MRINQTRIKTKIKKLQDKEAAIHRQIRELQDFCQHPNVEKTARSDTGNWDKSQDSYWYFCQCPDCQKIWNEDQ